MLRAAARAIRGAVARPGTSQGTVSIVMRAKLGSLVPSKPPDVDRAKEGGMRVARRPCRVAGVAHAGQEVVEATDMRWLMKPLSSPSSPMRLKRDASPPMLVEAQVWPTLVAEGHVCQVCGRLYPPMLVAAHVCGGWRLLSHASAVWGRLASHALDAWV